jgi:hypothetical protein
MIIQARQLETIETTLSKAQWIALISAGASFATSLVNAVS